MPQGSGGMIIYMVILFGIMYLFLIRPNSKKRKAEEEMRKNITIGDEVTTIGGIVGRIVAVKDDEDAFIIETGTDRVKMKFKKWAISTVNTTKEVVKSDKEQQLEALREQRAKAKEEKLAKKEKAKAKAAEEKKIKDEKAIHATV